MRMRHLLSGRDFGALVCRFFPRAGGFLAFIGGLGFLLAALRRFGRLARFLASGRAPRLCAELIGTRIQQYDRLSERNLLWGLVCRDRGVDTVVTHVGPVTAILDHNWPPFIGVFA